MTKQDNRKKPTNRPPKHSKRDALNTEIESLTTQTSDPKALAPSTHFSQLPMSSATQKGLSSASFVEMTEIQQSALPYALCGKDVLGAARTGSGKTLAFVLPVLECLYRAKWTQMDGLGALVISPTRELALQIFQVLRDVGKYHTLSAGLLIGGKDLKSEQQRVTRMNILICTPGRLLQHMDQTPEFSCDNLQILVLDEADRILDSGFQKTINAIIENLPLTRQTLLFSATQTKSVSDLARLSLNEPEYVAVHDTAVSATPKNLTQKYIVCDLHYKIDVLFAFIKSHTKQKIIVFLSSCKQVRFIFETFCKMQPGVPLMCLHGKQKQPKRVAIFEQFCRKKDACLFATDIASRGLDFPSVDWVFQLDCPEDVSTYIHRVGRTARYESAGTSLLLLLPTETAFIKHLAERKVPITETKANPAQVMHLGVSRKLAALCTEAPDIKYLAQKAFICYLKSIYLMKDKSVFDVSKIDVDRYAASLGLPGAPRIKFIKKTDRKNESRQQAMMNKEDSEVEEEEEEGVVVDRKKPKTKIDKMFEKKNLTVLSKSYEKLRAREEDDGESGGGQEAGQSDEEEFLSIKRRDHEIEDVVSQSSVPVKMTHRKMLKMKKKAIESRGKSRKVVFDEEGNAVEEYKFERSFEGGGENGYIEGQVAVLREADKEDRKVAQERLKEKKQARKKREREEYGSDFEEGARLGGVEEEESDGVKRVRLEEMAMRMLGGGG